MQKVFLEEIEIKFDNALETYKRIHANRPNCIKCILKWPSGVCNLTLMENLYSYFKQDKLDDEVLEKLAISPNFVATAIKIALNLFHTEGVNIGKD